MKKTFIPFIVLLLFISCSKKINNDITISQKDNVKQETNILTNNKEIDELQEKRNQISFELQTDFNIPSNSDNDINKLKDNVLVASINGEILDKYYSENGNQIEIISVDNSVIKIKSHLNRQFLGRNFIHSDTIIILNFENNKFTEQFRYTESEGSQSGPCIELQTIDFLDDTIKLCYSYQQSGDVVFVGYGTVSIEFKKISKYYFMSKFYSDVKGYFMYVEEDIAVPIMDPEQAYDFTVDRQVTKEDFLQLFNTHNSNLIVNESNVNKLATIKENLRLREEPDTKSAIITVMQSNEQVKILEIGKEDIIDNINGFWCLIETAEEKQLDNENTGVEQNTVTGWCFSGYLK